MLHFDVRFVLLFHAMASTRYSVEEVVAIAADDCDFNWSASDDDEDFFGEDCASGERDMTTRDYLTEAQDWADSLESHSQVC